MGALRTGLILAWIMAMGTWPDIAKAQERVALTMERLGDIRVGMNVDEAYRSLLRTGPAKKPASSMDDCDYYVPRHGLAFMVDKRVIVRIEVSEDMAVTSSGIRISDSIARVKAVLGNKVVDEPQFYDGPEARTLTVLSKDRKTAMRFEIYDNRVREIYAGYEASIHFVEGYL
jgi:hypothetical protein